MTRKEYEQIYYRKNRLKIIKKQKEFHKLHPWNLALKNAKQRCNNPNNSHYEWYGGKGIEFHLTDKEGELLWNRDKAWLMEHPTIDRKDNNEDYTFDNCQFIEKSINSGKDKRKIILQWDKNKNFIKEWESIIKASKTLKIDRNCIMRCLKGKYKTAGKFIWTYKLA